MPGHVRNANWPQYPRLGTGAISVTFDNLLNERSSGFTAEPGAFSLRERLPAYSCLPYEAEGLFEALAFQLACVSGELLVFFALQKILLKSCHHRGVVERSKQVLQALQVSSKGLHPGTVERREKLGRVTKFFTVDAQLMQSVAVKLLDIVPILQYLRPVCVQHPGGVRGDTFL